ncbi:hypothetical protein ACFCYH_18640 [Streptomyces sp. NPDC056400]|uniref:hypothetical protein n=1 Tax=Streptomyces sp. NPDC056400 TaxID=3345808 RepID=UPI0035DC444D
MSGQAGEQREQLVFLLLCSSVVVLEVLKGGAGGHDHAGQDVVDEGRSLAVVVLVGFTRRGTAAVDEAQGLRPLVSDLFGIHPSTAHGWARLAQNSWTDYLAAFQKTQ